MPSKQRLTLASHFMRRFASRGHNNVVHRLSVTDIIEPDLFVAAAAATATASAAPKGRVLKQTQTTSPALFKAATPSNNSSAPVADSKKQARPEPKVVEEPALKKQAAAAAAASSAAPTGRVLKQTQTTSPALVKAHAPSPTSSAPAAAGIKQARLEPRAVTEPVSKRQAPTHISYTPANCFR